MERRIQIDSSLAIGANDSSKSMPSTSIYTWATNLDLFWTTSPSSSVLFLKIHLVPITCVSLGLGTNSYTSFLINWYNSWCMDSTQFSSLKASSTLRVQIGQDITIITLRVSWKWRVPYHEKLEVELLEGWMDLKILVFSLPSWCRRCKLLFQWFSLIIITLRHVVITLILFMTRSFTILINILF